ncbi:MAG: 4Fe-4S binding protein [Candidatus Bathyarchaeia archaeon]
MRLSKKAIRCLRWTVKAVFLFLFTAPLSQVLKGQIVDVKTFFSVETVAKVPITQSPDSIWLSYYGNINPGLWIIEPLGGLQVLLTGQVEADLLIPTVVAVLIFVTCMILLGNVFCSWACPIGTLIDSFDMLVGKISFKIEFDRERRRLQSNHGGGEKRTRACLICPLYMRLVGKKGFLAKGITFSALFATVLLRYPAFCVICPIGIVSRGMIHLKSIKTALAVKGTQLILWLEMFTIPFITLFLSLRERRYWCRHLCPVGFILGVIGAFNLFFKPKVKENRCIMYGCPEDCEDYSMDYCAACRLMDAKKCERACPADIDLVGHGSLARCTKCLECYITCDYDAIAIDFLGKPDALHLITQFYSKTRRLKGRDS